MESRIIDVELENSIKGKLRRDSPLSAKCCIFKVPEVLRRHKPEAYQPVAVSIGPFHHGSGKKFEHMENVKHWYLSKLLSRLDMSLETLIKRIAIVEFGREARAFYADPLNDLNQNDFIEMMILDGCFLLELFFRNVKLDKEAPSTQAKKQGIEMEKPDNIVQETDACIQILDIDNDSIFNMGCMVQYLCHDLLLLENQLPWFVLKRLYSLTIGQGNPDPPETSLTQLVLKFFSSVPELGQHCAFCYLYRQDNEILHILDLIRSAIVDPFEEFKSSTESDTNLLPATLLSKAGVEFVKGSEDGNIMNIDSKKGVLTNLLPATLLSEAGVEFEKGSKDGNIMNIKFKNGVLTIPRVAIAELTEPLFRNLIAFEQCYHGCEHIVTSYARLMDMLIASSNDVHFLCKKGILGNWLSDEDAFRFFDKLYNDTFIRDFRYDQLCSVVNEYQTHRRNEWRAKLKRDHCSNPWKIISVVAASILLVLTVLQTAYTIQQYYYPRQ